MAGERIVLAELDIDVQALIKSNMEARTSMAALRTEQAELKKAGLEGSAQFAANAAEIKRLTPLINQQSALLAAQTTAQGKLISTQERVNQLIKAEAVSIQDAKNQNSELIKLRNSLNLTTEEGQKSLKDINAKLDENNDFIKANVSGLEQQKMGIGDYASGIREALKDTGLFSGALGAMGADANGVINIFQSFSPVFNNLNQQFNTLIGDMGIFRDVADETAAATEGNTAATGQLTIAQNASSTASRGAAASTGILNTALKAVKLTLAALGIGLIIAAVVILVDAFKSFTPLIDKVEQGMAAVGAVFKVLTNLFTALFTGTKSLSEAFSGLGGAMSKAANDAIALKKAQQDLEDAMALQEIQSARNRAEINRLNIQAKDRTKTEEERLALLEKSMKLEEDDYKQRKRNADETYRQALEKIRLDAELSDSEFARLKAISDMQINTNADMTDAEAQELMRRAGAFKEFVEGRTNDVDEMFEKLAEAQKGQIDLDSEYYNNQEKLINKQNKLLEDKEAAEQKAEEARKKAIEAAQKAEEERQQKIQEALNNAAQKSKLLLDKFLSEQGVRAKSLEDELGIAEKVRDGKLEIAQKEFEASEKTENDRLQLIIARNQAIDEFNKKSAEISIAFAEQELRAIVGKNEAILNNERFLSQALFNEKKGALDAIANAERAYQKQRLDEGLINEQQYNDEINKINDASRQKQAELAEQRKIAQREKELADIENRKVAEEENFVAQMELEKERLEIQRQQELEEAELSGADKQAIIEKYAQLQKNVDKSVEEFKLQQRAAVLSGLKGLFGEESKIGKAVALAEIVNTTAQNATKAFTQASVYASNPLTAALAPNAYIQGGIIIATGAAQAARTVGAKFEKGGFVEIGGKRHSEGGTKFWGEDGTSFEAENGELIGVMNRNAARHFMAFNNSFPAGGVARSNYFETGGIVSREIAPERLDFDAFAAKLADANRQLPAPVVSVREIITEANDYTAVRAGANF